MNANLTRVNHVKRRRIARGAPFFFAEVDGDAQI